MMIDLCGCLAASTGVIIESSTSSDRFKDDRHPAIAPHVPCRVHEFPDMFK